MFWAVAHVAQQHAIFKYIKNILVTHILIMI